MTDCRQKAPRLYDSVIKEGAQACGETYWRTRTARIFSSSWGKRRTASDSSERKRRKIPPRRRNGRCSSVHSSASDGAGKGYEVFLFAAGKFPECWRLFAADDDICRLLRRYEDAFRYPDKAEKLEPSNREPAFSWAARYEERVDCESACRIRCVIAERLCREACLNKRKK